MKVALYNQMFGICGTNLLSNALGHLAVHFQTNPQKAYRRANLSKTIQTINESKSDIVGICEVLEGQEEELRDGLEKIGYKYCFFGEGHKTKHSDLHVQVAIASKIPCEVVQEDGFPIKNKMGGGGGYLRCKLIESKTELFCVHLSFPKKRKLYQKQIKFLSENVNKSKNKIILLGDFNLPFEKIKDRFPNMKLLSDKIKTCSITPVLRLLKFKDLDHILVKGFDGINPEAISGNSDHKLIVVELVSD